MNDDSETSDEDTVDKITERLKRVKKFLERERTRSMCYAAAMSRRWDVPADHFHERTHGPKKWKLKGRGYVYKTAEENGGVKSMVEMCLDVIDAAYETMGESVRPEKRWVEAGLAVPTAYEHNECASFVVRDVHGEAAGAAYEGYVGNRGNFTDPGDRGRAERLDRPHSVYLQTLTRQWATAPAEIGANALSIAAVVRTTPKTREIRFLHTRETYEEKGHASACVTAMKDDTPAGHSLATHYAACNTRLSALFYLSLGFRADIASCSADMPQPGSLTPGGSSQMTFMWTRPREEDEAAACVEHLAFVKYVRAKQATRRSDSATDFVAGLDRVVAKLERNLGSAHRLAVRTPPATPPSRGPSRGSKRSRT